MERWWRNPTLCSKCNFEAEEHARTALCARSGLALQAQEIVRPARMTRGATAWAMRQTQGEIGRAVCSV
jgi:hypothetical protein